MLQDYLPILLQVIVAIGFAAVGLLVSVLVGRVGKRNPVKDSAYECGMLPIGDAQPRFSVKFYLVAMLFILFDIEIVFMYPWAVAYRDYLEKFGPWTIFGSMLSFVTILMVGFVYALKKGALEWNRR
jgi:NADH-quinone oxidoreductase subunit A